MTTTDTAQSLPDAPDASDVVTGPIGSAHLREPATSDPEGADLDRRPVIEPAADQEPRAVEAGLPSRS